jgi:hypothetical protein
MGSLATVWSAALLVLVAALPATAVPVVTVDAAPGRPVAVLVDPGPDTAGCTVTLAGHPAAKRAARGTTFASAVARTHPLLFHAAAPPARRDLHVAAVVACPDGRRETSAAVRLFVRGARGTRGRLAPKRWLQALAAALATRIAELEATAGTPEQKRDWAEAVRAAFRGDDDEDALAPYAYDPAEDVIASETIHGTEIVVAVPRGTVSGPTPLVLARTIFTIFHTQWHVFAGFPLDRYVVRVRAQAAGSTRSIGGLVVDAHDTAFPTFSEFVAHQTFQAWAGGVLFPKRTHLLYPVEDWLLQGGAAYYALRAVVALDGDGALQAGMTARLDEYRDRRSSEANLSIPDLSLEIGTGTGTKTGLFSSMFLARSALLAYVLDARLVDAGTSLDAVLRRLYASPGLDGLPIVEADVDAAIAAEAGEAVRAEHAARRDSAVDLEPLVAGGFPLLPH